MRRSRRVYQAPDYSETETPVASDVENGDANSRSTKNVNNDPAQPLRGPPRTRGPSTDSSKHQQPGGSEHKLAESSDDSEETDESCFLARCLCCWRRNAASRTVGEVGNPLSTSVCVRVPNHRFVPKASHNPLVSICFRRSRNQRFLFF